MAEEINKSWQCLVAEGEGNGWRVPAVVVINPPEMTLTSGNGDVDRHNTEMIVGGDPGAIPRGWCDRLPNK